MSCYFVIRITLLLFLGFFLALYICLCFLKPFPARNGVLLKHIAFSWLLHQSKFIISIHTASRILLRPARYVVESKFFSSLSNWDYLGPWSVLRSISRSSNQMSASTIRSQGYHHPLILAVFSFQIPGLHFASYIKPRNEEAEQHDASKGIG